MSVPQPDSSTRLKSSWAVRNPALLATIVLPVFAIVSSLGMTAVAYLHGDAELPEQYHWEGALLDRDFADTQHAAELDVRASLEFVPASGTCRVVLKGAASTSSTLTLALTHGSLPQLDQRVRLFQHEGGYEGPCRTLQAGHWRVDLADEPATWRLRREFSGASMTMALSARPN